MSDDVVELKRGLRGLLRQKTAALPAEAWSELSRSARDVLRGRAEWSRAGRVLFYYPLERELDLCPLMAEALAGGRLVALPRYRPSHGDYEAAAIVDVGRDLEPGWRGIPEPRSTCATVPLNQLDLVLVPGVGFAPDGQRLGRGKGFYDRLLANVWGVRCGVAGDWQVVEVIPAQPHDERVECIVTPTRWIVCRPRAV